MDTKDETHVAKALLENPPQSVLDAMAEERSRQIRANGHGNYGYRDIWLAGVRSLRVFAK